MAEQKTNDEGNAQISQSSSGGKSPLILLVLLINTSALAIVAYFQFQFFQKSAQQPSLVDLVQAELKSQNNEAGQELRDSLGQEEGILLPLEAFTVNLAQGEGPRRYLRMETVLKFDKSAKEDEFQARKPQIRDTIIGILNSKRPEDLLKKEGKFYLKEEIKTAINSFLVDGEIVDLYYVGFQIN